MTEAGSKLTGSGSQERNKGQWTSPDKLPLQPEQPVKVWIKDLETAVILCKFVFTNKDGSTGELYPASNSLGLSSGKFQTLYKKRWCVEAYYISLKQFVHNLDHFALKAKMYLAA
jgi:hypothetical protein